MNDVQMWIDHHFWLTVGLCFVFAFVLSQVWIALFVYCICGWMPATYPAQQINGEKS